MKYVLIYMPAQQLCNMISVSSNTGKPAVMWSLHNIHISVCTISIRLSSHSLDAVVWVTAYKLCSSNSIRLSIAGPNPTCSNSWKVGQMNKNWNMLLQKWNLPIITHYNRSVCIADVHSQSTIFPTNERCTMPREWIICDIKVNTEH